MAHLQSRQAAGEVVTGLLYVDPEPEDLHAHLNTVSRPLNRLGEKDLCPGSAALEALNNEYLEIHGYEQCRCTKGTLLP